MLIIFHESFNTTILINKTFKLKPFIINSRQWPNSQLEIVPLAAWKTKQLFTQCLCFVNYNVSTVVFAWSVYWKKVTT